MTLPLKYLGSGKLSYFATADVLNVDTVEPRSAGHLVIGATLGASDEVRLGVVGETVRVMGVLAVDTSLDMTTGNIDNAGAISCLDIDVDGKSTHELQAQDTATGATTVNWNNGQEHRLTLTGNVTLSFTNLSPAAAMTGAIKIVMGGAGSFTITWPTVAWVGNIEPSISTIPVTDGIYAFFKWDGAEYVGSFTAQFIS